MLGITKTATLLLAVGAVLSGLTNTADAASVQRRPRAIVRRDIQRCEVNSDTTFYMYVFPLFHLSAAPLSPLSLLLSLQNIPFSLAFLLSRVVLAGLTNTADAASVRRPRAIVRRDIQHTHTHTRARMRQVAQ